MSSPKLTSWLQGLVIAGVIASGSPLLAQDRPTTSAAVHSLGDDAQAVNLMHSDQLAAQVLAGAGAALTLTGIVMVLLAPDNIEHETDRGFSFGCGARGCGASVRGRY